ncbi:MAG: bifunctional demethylmenaquinone methyltransferase/2-methoxy-6-polyprenyl-1,4-benzoquinol methylase UbiE [Flavobacteriaceae bacterium]|nr:bifunctional demethylmenaquinone methyltransferase/2-methoxy-6-polyprenyl-1,4-benzoquinol methylase UbiE [Flavobacteriaceae bacterium]
MLENQSNLNTKVDDSASNKTLRVENMFDRIAPKYDFFNRLFSLRIDLLWRKNLVNWMQSDDPKQILDVATGTGELAIALWKKFRVKITAVDLSQEMLNLADKKIKQLGADITIQKANAENLPFESNKFDAVSVGFGVRNFENLEKGLSELRRVVKENGNVYILEFSRMEGVLSPLYNFYFNKVLPFLAKMISGEKEAYAYLPDSVKNFPCGERMKNILLDLGFSKVEYKKLSLGIVTIYKAKK